MKRTLITAAALAVLVLNAPAVLDQGVGVQVGPVGAGINFAPEQRTHLREYERRWRARLWPEIRAGLAFRAIASRLSDRTIDRVVELARVDGIVPLLKQTADFNWHGAAARSLLRHPSFRRIVFDSIWS